MAGDDEDKDNLLNLYATRDCCCYFFLQFGAKSSSLFEYNKGWHALFLWFSW